MFTTALNRDRPGRRVFATGLLKALVGLASLVAVTAGAAVAPSRADEKVIRIGFQKYGTLVLLKSKGTARREPGAARLHGTSGPSFRPDRSSLKR